MARVHVGHLGQQGLGVGVVGFGKQLFDWRSLDHAAQVHHHHPVADVLDDAQVMADEQIGQVQLLAQVHEQVQDLRLDRHIEGGNRLVTDQHAGLHRQRARDTNALALATAELVRVAAAQGRVQPGALHLRTHVIVKTNLVDQAMDAGCFADDLVHAQARVQAGVRVLKNHLDAQALGMALSRRQAGHGLAGEQHLAIRRGQQPRRYAAQGGFAATGFAHQAHHLAGAHQQIDTVDRAGHRVGLFQAQALQQAPAQTGLLLTKTLADLAQLHHRGGQRGVCRGCIRHRVSHTRTSRLCAGAALAVSAG